MRAIILAAGLGLRLQQPPQQQFPKCLLRFQGVTLLERHLRALRALGVDEVELALGFQPEQIAAELDRIGWQPRPAMVLNERYDLGSVLTVHTMADALTRGGDVLLMDADVLYDEAILQALAAGPNTDRLLIDREFETGDEPVKLCLKNGVPVELRKQVAVGLQYDTIGESVGFFRFRQDTARRLVEIVAGYVSSGRAHMPHEEAVRDLLLEGGRRYDVADVTGLPWIEIDFPGDVARAEHDVLPRLAQSAGVAR